MSASDQHDRKVRAREETAQMVREVAAKGGVQMTQTEARARVDKACDRGDRIRDNNNR